MKAELEKLRHARSAKDFPNIKLNEDEHVELSIRRSLLGVIAIWLISAVCIVAITTILIIIFNDQNVKDMVAKLPGSARSSMYVIIAIIYILALLIPFVLHIVYKSNTMLITNQRAIQVIRSSLFNTSTNIIELQKIEDVSFHKNGVLDTIFNIGTLRMSTVGDETTYTFTMLDTPHDEVERISELVKASHHRKAREDAKAAAEVASEMAAAKGELAPKPEQKKEA